MLAKINGPFHTGNFYFESRAKFQISEFFFHKIEHVLYYETSISKVIYFKSGLFTIESFLQKRPATVEKRTLII